MALLLYCLSTNNLQTKPKPDCSSPLLENNCTFESIVLCIEVVAPTKTSHRSFHETDAIKPVLRHFLARADNLQFHRVFAYEFY